MPTRVFRASRDPRGRRRRPRATAAAIPNPFAPVGGEPAFSSPRKRSSRRRRDARWRARRTPPTYSDVSRGSVSAVARGRARRRVPRASPPDSACKSANPPLRLRASNQRLEDSIRSLVVHVVVVRGGGGGGARRGFVHASGFRRARRRPGRIAASRPPRGGRARNGWRTAGARDQTYRVEGAPRGRARGRVAGAPAGAAVVVGAEDSSPCSSSGWML